MSEFHALNLSLHPDWTLVLSAALPASLLAVALAVCVLSFALRHGHRKQRAELARIFEQLDLLRLDAQQSGAATSHAPSAAARAGAKDDADAALMAAVIAREPQIVGSVGDYYAAAQLAARGSSAAEIANRCGIVSGEARVLVALQQARTRRTAH